MNFSSSRRVGREAGGRPCGRLGFSMVILSLIVPGVASRAFAQEPRPDVSPEALKKMSVEELLNTEVTSVSRRAEKLSEAASAIQVITQEDIRRSGATRLGEALRLATNLQVAQVDSRQWAISARGFNSTTANKLLVLIDGRTVYTPLYSGVFWDAQDTPLNDVERIEVISGPGATLWGSNAVNGVINVITKSAKDTHGLLLSGGGGMGVRGFGDLRYGGAVSSKVDVRVYGKGFSRDPSMLTNGLDATDHWYMGQGGFRLDWDASSRDTLTLQGDVYDGRIAQTNPNDIAVGGGNVVGRWSRSFSENSTLGAQFYYDRTHRNIPGTFTEDLDTYDVDFQHRIHLGSRNDVVWGLAYRLIHDTVGNSPGLAFLPPQVTRSWISGFAQDEIALIENRLHLVLGTKIEHNDYTGVEVQPSGRLNWKVNPKHTLWGAVSRAVRTPSRIDRELFAPATPPYILAGGSNFVSEKLVAYEAGYRAQLHDALSLSLAAFYNVYDDLRSLERLNPPATSPSVLANGQEGTVYGAEVSVDYPLANRWRVRAGYTGLHVELRAKPGSTAAAGTSESNDPEHQLFIRSSVDLPSNLELDGGFRYVARLVNQAVPAYAELDARLGWHVTPRVELSLVGQNLLHDHHPEFGAGASRREIERHVYGTLLWHF